MQSEFKKIKIFIILFLFIAFIAGSFILVGLILSDNDESFSSLIEQADDYIASAYYDFARELLNEAYLLAEGDYYHLIVLKRMYLVSRALNSWKYLQEYSLLSLEEMPGNKNIIHFACYSSLRSGDISKTWEILTGSGNIQDLNNLWIELNLKYDGRTEELLEEDKPILTLLFKNDPEIFIEYGVLEKDNRLLIDAALLYMIEGDPQKALNVLENIDGDEYFELLSFIAYDAGYIEQAIEILRDRILKIFSNGRFDLAVFLADLYLINGDYEQAVDLYRQVINKISEISVTSYLNISWILQKQNKDVEAEALLESGLSVYNNDFRLLKELVILKIRMENKEGAAELLNDYLNSNPQNLDARLLSFSLINKTQGIAFYEARLWQLFEDNSNNEDICKYIMWHLIQLDNLTDARLALDIFSAANGNGNGVAWYMAAMGIIEGLNGNIKKAVKYLGESLNIEENGYVRYNRAVLYLYENRPYLALLDLNMIDFESFGTENAFYMSIVYYLFAELHYFNNNIPKAIEECNYSLKANPDNNKTHVLLKKLEKTQ